MTISFQLREFLRAFPTAEDFERGDTGFFVDVAQGVMIFYRAGVEVSRLELTKLDRMDPASSFDLWRRRFKRTEEWRPGRGRDD